MQNQKIKTVQKILKKKQKDAIVFFKKENIGYLTDISAEDSLLVVSHDGCFLFLTPIYFSEFRKLNTHLCLNLISSVDFFSSFQEIVRKKNPENILIEVNIPYGFFIAFQKKFKKIKFFPAIDIVEKMRIIKDEDEISRIKSAADIALRGYDYMVSLIDGKNTEKSIKDRFEFYLKDKLGAQKIPFDIIVASGERSCYPHAIPVDSCIEKNSFIVVDWGVQYQDYCCDITRTFFLGNPTMEQKKIYYTVYDAQKKAIDAIRDGADSKKIVNIVTSLFEEKKLLKYYIHGLGHGVGREVHEMPRLSAKSDIVLKENMVLTIEPGLYVPGVGGVRIEDTVIVKKDGCEIITDIPKKFVRF